MSKIYTGTKFFKYSGEGEDEKLDVLRITREENEKGIFGCIDLDGNKYWISKDELIDNYTMLNPDGLMSISIVELDESPDIIVSVANLKKSDNLPFAICRQCMYDFFTNEMIKDPDRTMYLGASVNRKTCPANIDFNLLTTCNSIRETRFIAVYLDDNLDTILGLIRTKKYDDILRQIHVTMNKIYEGKNIIGLNDTLRDLLVDLQFMYDFRSCFDVFVLDDAFKENATCLSDRQLEQVKKYYHINNIKCTYVIPYNKEIKLSDVVKKYFLATSSDDDYKKIYIVAYDIIKE